MALVVGARPLSRHGASSRAGVELEPAPGRRGQRPGARDKLLVWHLESASGTRLVGAVEFQFTGADRVVHTHIVRANEPVSAELPGDLAVAAGRLLRRLAHEGLTRVARDR